MPSIIIVIVNIIIIIIIIVLFFLADLTERRLIFPMSEVQIFTIDRSDWLTYFVVFRNPSMQIPRYTSAISGNGSANIPAARQQILNNAVVGLQQWKSRVSYVVRVETL
jgi:hypothetical protein